MDNAFQELDYSDISAKNLNKKNRSNDLNTKTRGGIIRLGSLIIITIIVIILIITLITAKKTHLFLHTIPIITISIVIIK